MPSLGYGYSVMVRGVGPPPYFTGKNMLRICLERVLTVTDFQLLTS
jgi:hypothetical protein